MIENFTSAAFEAALPAGKWRYAGICPKSNQRMYSVTPYPGISFAILVYSSILMGGVSSKEAGHDSIRCRITKDGERYGGKPVRWIDRRPGWQGRLLEYLRALANQIDWLRKVTCPGCGGLLTPFTSRKGKVENKGRGFVCCKKEGCARPAWHWCEDEDGNPMIVQAAPVTKPAQNVTGPVPTCPRCNTPMVRMTSGKGWRCGIKGNRFLGEKWTLCNGTIWDNAKSTPETISAAIATTLTAEQQTQALMADVEGGDGEPVQARRTINLSEAKREQRRQANDGSEAAAIGRAVGGAEGIKPPTSGARPAPIVQGFTVDAYSLRQSVGGAVNELRRINTDSNLTDAARVEAVGVILGRLGKLLS